MSPLSAGDRVPADARLIETRNLHLQEAALTGESLPGEDRGRPAGGSLPFLPGAGNHRDGQLSKSGVAEEARFARRW